MPPKPDDEARRARAAALIADIRRLTTRPWRIMEVCGGQTHALAHYGLEELLPPEITLLHGPGCPVCVTPVAFIDAALKLATRENVILGSYGDMLRVPGSRGDLLGAKARGADVRLFYSPWDAVELAAREPGKTIVFLAVGFETTAPATALALRRAEALGLHNFLVICAHVLVPPVLEMLMDMPDAKPDALLAPGHVCAVTGERDYARLAERHHLPVVVTGFEATDLLAGIAACVAQLERGESRVENAYARAVRPEGNPHALALMQSVFEPIDRPWRGLGTVPGGGMRLRGAYARFDACAHWGLAPETEAEPATACRAGEVLRGVLPPDQCPAFGTACTPQHPLGAPMVSGEGSCAAFYRYAHTSPPSQPAPTSPAC